MNFLKGLALGLLSSLLFLSLSIFGLAFTLNQTVLSPKFITSELDKLDVSSLVEETIGEQMPAEDFPQELKTALVNTITKLEPLVKEQISAAAYPIYDYLLDKSQSLDLAPILRNTFFNSDFIVSLIDELDLPSLIEEIISEQVSAEDFPQELKTALVSTITELEPLIKERVIPAADPFFDYLLGESQSLDLTPILRNTFFNSDFVVSLIDELDLPSLVEGIISQQMPAEDFTEEFGTALVNTISRLKPLIREQIGAAADPVFAYLLGDSQSLDLSLTLRNTILNADFAISLIDELNISSLAGEFLGEQLTGEIPEEMKFLIEYLDDAIAELEPTIKEELNAAADPILDYLLGESQSLNVVISLESIIASLEEPLREALEESLPAEYADLLQSELDRLFDKYFAQLTEVIPATFELDESLLGAEIPTQIAEALTEGEKALEQARQDITEGLAETEGMQQMRQDIAEVLAEAEDGLEQVKPYVGYFQLGYKLLIGFMVLLILGIILINRQVKDTSRGLGITFLIYGAFEYAGIFIAKHFAGTQLAELDMPVALQGLPLQLLNDFLSPLQSLSLGLLIGGIVLITVSFVYKSRS